MTKIFSEEVVHHGTEQIFYNHNHKSLLNGRFELYNSITSQALSSSFGAYKYKNIITNYMIEKNPKYLNNYLALWFNKSSKYITEKAYCGLLNDSIKAQYVNSTLSSVETLRQEYIPGIKSEYNEIRVPTQLLSRSISYSEFIDNGK